MDDERQGLTRGDPLGPEPEAPPATRRRSGDLLGYGGGPVPPGALRAPEPRPPAPPREELASWGRRVGATVIDGLILGVLTVVLLTALGAGVFGDAQAGVVELLVGALLATVVFTALALLYAPLLMVRTNGQTIGKRVARCRVVRTDGHAVGFWWAALREVAVKGLLLGVAASLTGGIAYLVDGAWPLIDPERRALHDYVVDSRVVRS